jgi:outer membrane murein-binding lipoprotein Lpp
MFAKIARGLVLGAVTGTAFVAAGCASNSKQPPYALTGEARNQPSDQDQARGDWKAGTGIDPRTGKR